MKNMLNYIYIMEWKAKTYTTGSP